MAGYRVEICGVNTAKLPLLKATEKEELILKIKQGDREAREEYIKGNLRLVLSIIQRFNSGNENVDDLFQIGCIGLMKAIDNFDLTQGVKFSTYAVPMIIGEIRRYLRDNNAIRVSRGTRDLAYRALQMRDKLTKEQMVSKATEVAKLVQIETLMDRKPGELSGGDDSRRSYVTLGQFSIVRLERDTQLLIPAYDYCLPEKECTCGNDDRTFDTDECPERYHHSGFYL